MNRLSIYQKFLIYGVIGLLMEILWTGLNSLLNMDYTMTGHTSVIMLPIYGMTVFLEPLFMKLKTVSWVYRGCIYALIILGCEFVTGYILKGMGICPWDYTNKGVNICGVIRLDYIPLWFFAGLFLEDVSGKICSIREDSPA